jgi:hypothetical protein
VIFINTSNICIVKKTSLTKIGYRNRKSDWSKCLKGVYGRSGRPLRAPVRWTRIAFRVARARTRARASKTSRCDVVSRTLPGFVLARECPYRARLAYFLTFPFWNFSGHLQMGVFCAYPIGKSNLRFYFREVDEKSW